jgi:hypothetical protein
MRVETIAARGTPSAGISEKTLAAERIWPSGARPAASLLISILRQPSPAKRVKRRDRRFFHSVFPPQIRAKPACPHGRDDDGRTTPPRPPRPRPRLPDRNSKPAPASARPPRCSCGGRHVTVRLCHCPFMVGGYADPGVPCAVGRPERANPIIVTTTRQKIPTSTQASFAIFYLPC